MFQFLIGTLKTLAQFARHPYIGGFQFLIGTLKTSFAAPAVGITAFVSIPHRYAKNSRKFGYDVILVAVSIPHRYAKNPIGVVWVKYILIGFNSS